MRAAEPDPPSQNGGLRTMPAAAKQEAIRALLDRWSRNRDGGEYVPETQLIADHPTLMPELGQALAEARGIRQAMLAAQKAGPIDEPLLSMSASDLEAPIDDFSDGMGEVDHGPAPAILGYAILEEISSGGQAVVFKSVQESTGRTVAIKVLPGGPFTSSKHRERFERETGILARLDHPNIVNILDRGRTADGSFFFVMPFITGFALDEFLEKCRVEHPHDPRPAMRLLAKIADAVGEAHRRGVIHRDLKPSNIRIDDRGEPHVLDFGLARPLSAAGADHRARTVTQQGQVVGSLPWASPEQAEGRRDLNVRSDVYSLGVILYESLTGGFPYEVYGSVRDALDNISKTVPEAPSRKTGGWSAHISRSMDGVVLKCLAKSPENRYESASELAQDLERCLSGQQTQAMPPRLRSRIPWRRLILTSMLSSTILSAGGAWYLAHRTRTVTVAELPAIRNSIGMRLVRIPAGTFGMGSPLNEPGRDPAEQFHMVKVPTAFYMSTTEVTVKQYRAVMGQIPNDRGAGSDDLPAAHISWTDAMEFCRRLGERDHGIYRLPNEIEWEYACRAGSTEAVSGTGRLDDMGWYAGNSGQKLHPVAQKSPNQWGLYDMHGGVEEWCSDSYLTGDSAGSRQRVIRGGTAESGAEWCRSAARAFGAADSPRVFSGFRVVLQADANHP